MLLSHFFERFKKRKLFFLNILPEKKNKIWVFFSSFYLNNIKYVEFDYLHYLRRHRNEYIFARHLNTHGHFRIDPRVVTYHININIISDLCIWLLYTLYLCCVMLKRLENAMKTAEEILYGHDVFNFFFFLNSLRTRQFHGWNLKFFVSHT